MWSNDILSALNYRAVQQARERRAQEAKKAGKPDGNGFGRFKESPEGISRGKNGGAGREEAKPRELQSKMKKIEKLMEDLQALKQTLKKELAELGEMMD